MERRPMNANPIPPPPFCWQDKRALRLIREQLDRPKVMSSIAVYTALTEYASNKESESFQVSIGHIATLAGCGERTVKARLNDLRNLSLIQTTCPALKTALTFRLLPTQGAIAAPDGCRTLGNNRTTQGKRTAPLLAPNRRIEEKNTPNPQSSSAKDMVLDEPAKETTALHKGKPENEYLPSSLPLPDNNQKRECRPTAQQISILNQINGLSKAIVAIENMAKIETDPIKAQSLRDKVTKRQKYISDLKARLEKTQVHD